MIHQRSTTERPLCQMGSAPEDLNEVVKPLRPQVRGRYGLLSRSIADRTLRRRRVEQTVRIAHGSNNKLHTVRLLPMLDPAGRLPFKVIHVRY